jgi:hypothetical protein
MKGVQHDGARIHGAGATLKRKLRLFALSSALVAVPSSFVHPFGAVKAQRSDRPLLLDASFDAQVVGILERSCQNCHSERTVWPWYSYVAPVSWMIENDVQGGRRHMNLSRWNGYRPERQQEILSEMSSVVKRRVMPLPRYLLIHPEARLSDTEVDYLYHWAKSERNRFKTASASANSAFTGTSR